MPTCPSRLTIVLVLLSAALGAQDHQETRLVDDFLQQRANYPDFNQEHDLLIAQYDNGGDPDDLMAQAAFGCMLLDQEFADLQYHGVIGAGRGRSAKNSSSLMRLAFGQEGTDWTWTGGKSSESRWANAVEHLKNIAKAQLQDPHGHVWIAEGGQSNFTHDWVKALLDENNGIDVSVTRKRIHLVQHSVPNENGSNDSQLASVKSWVDYIKIHDGNYNGNEMAAGGWNRDANDNNSPDYETDGEDIRNGGTVTGPQEIPFHQILRTNASTNANAHPQTKAIWEELERIIANISGFQGEDYSPIPSPRLGIDFSDHVESIFALSIGSGGSGIDPRAYYSIPTFWQRFVLTDNIPTITATTKLEAEDARIATSVIVAGGELKTDDANASGNAYLKPIFQDPEADGYKPASHNIDDWYQPFIVNWGFALTKAGSTTITVRFRSSTAGQTRESAVYLNGIEIGRISTNAATWQQKTFSELNGQAGINLVEIKEVPQFQNKGLDVDYIEVGQASTEKDPVSVLTIPSTATTGESVTLDGSASSDDGTIIEYRFRVFDSSNTRLLNERSQDSATSYTFTTAGTYSVELRVEDNAGQRHISRESIIITDQPAQRSIQLTLPLEFAADIAPAAGSSTITPDGPETTVTFTALNPQQDYLLEILSTVTN